METPLEIPPQRHDVEPRPATANHARRRRCETPGRADSVVAGCMAARRPDHGQPKVSSGAARRAGSTATVRLRRLPSANGEQRTAAGHGPSCAVWRCYSAAPIYRASHSSSLEERLSSDASPTLLFLGGFARAVWGPLSSGIAKVTQSMRFVRWQVRVQDTFRLQRSRKFRKKEA